jgi:hypothetical protein
MSDRGARPIHGRQRPPALFKARITGAEARGKGAEAWVNSAKAGINSAGELDGAVLSSRRGRPAFHDAHDPAPGRM